VLEAAQVPLTLRELQLLVRQRTPLPGPAPHADAAAVGARRPCFKKWLEVAPHSFFHFQLDDEASPG